MHETDTMSVTKSVTETDFMTVTSIEEVPTTRTYISTQVIDETKVDILFFTPSLQNTQMHHRPRK